METVPVPGQRQQPQEPDRAVDIPLAQAHNRGGELLTLARIPNRLANWVTSSICTAQLPSGSGAGSGGQPPGMPKFRGSVPMNIS